MPVKTKIGRNDPCPCGSERKYKKCCLNSPGPRAVPNRAARASGPPPEVIAKAIHKFREKDEALKEWARRYGHIRPCISMDFQKHKFVAVCGRLCYSENWKFIPDFLRDYVPSVFGKEWWDAELVKPEQDQHPLFQWRAASIKYMNSQPPRPDGSYSAPPSGPLSAYMSFAFNLFAIEDNSRLDDVLLARLRRKDQFQGARHEVFAEATCLRAGFSIEREDERDGSRRHAEFTAKHKATGQLISVEAKSRHRPGVLGQPGTPQPHEKLSLRFGALLNEAIAKNPTHPLVVFIDTNLPRHAAGRVLGRNPLDPYKPSRIMAALLDRDRREHGGEDRYAMLVFTNHPQHYLASDELDTGSHVLAVMPDRPKVDHPEAVWSLYEAANLYGNIPNEFPPQ